MPTRAKGLVPRRDNSIDKSHDGPERAGLILDLKAGNARAETRQPCGSRRRAALHPDKSANTMSVYLVQPVSCSNGGAR